MVSHVVDGHERKLAIDTGRLVTWTNEEGTQFESAMMGLGVAIDAFDAVWSRNRFDHGGVRNCEQEFSEAEDMALGVNVFLHAALRLAEDDVVTANDRE